ncbi:MAG: hypothetical protein JWR07_1803 [Nevskia sp.]|nr:hypothetical protein [Nevskia sp.]
MSTQFILVDFENVQPNNVGPLTGIDKRVKVFVGASQTKVPFELARALQALGSSAEYIQVSGNGSNALDFHIAFYIGKLASENPGASFHIVSKDTGFDPLIKHLSALQIECQRTATFGDVAPPVRISNSKPLTERVDAIVDNLAKRKSGRPRTLKTLGGSIRSLFVNKISEEEVADLVKQLQERKVVVISDGKVSYQLP